MPPTLEEMVRDFSCFEARRCGAPGAGPGARGRHGAPRGPTVGRLAGMGSTDVPARRGPGRPGTKSGLDRPGPTPSWPHLGT